MPDFLKKADRRIRAVAHDGEESLAAIFVRPRQGETTKALGAPGGTLSRIGRLADEAGDTPEGEAPPHPADLLRRNGILVLTTRRLLVFGHGSYTGRVRGLTGEIAFADLASIAIDAPEGAPATLDITFADGTAVSLTPGSRRRRFVEAWEQVSAPATDARS